jgi:lipopolysaccharide transport system permease protein
MNPAAPTANTRATVIRPSSGWFDLDLRSVWQYRELLFILAWRDVQLRYKQAGLGIAWAIIQPLFAVAIFTVIFGRFAKFPSGNVPYSVFAFAGILMFTYFSEATRRASAGLVTDAELIRKIYFPRLIMPLGAVVSPLIDFGFAFVVFLGLMFWFGVALTWKILLLPFVLIIAMMLALAMGLWLGPVNVRYRDVTHAIPFVLQVWMYASPIIYPLSIVPEKWQALYSLNPLVGIIEAFRWVTLDTPAPDFVSIGVSFVAILALLAGGLVYFRRRERGFADII